MCSWGLVFLSCPFSAMLLHSCGAGRISDCISLSYQLLPIEGIISDSFWLFCAITIICVILLWINFSHFFFLIFLPLTDLKLSCPFRNSFYNETVLLKKKGSFTIKQILNQNIKGMQKFRFYFSILLHKDGFFLNLQILISSF